MNATAGAPAPGAEPDDEALRRNAALLPSARRAIGLLPLPKPWLKDAAGDLDVAIIGGGQSGVAIAFALRRAGIDRVGVFEAAERGGAGVWTTTARMETLRTDKKISGLELGIPELTFEYWCRHVHGDAAYEAMPRIPRTLWAQYLDWYRELAAIDIAYGERLTDVRPAEGGLELTIGERCVRARKLVLATGVDGLGAPYTPDVIARAIPPALRAHTAEPIDFGQLKGKRIGVIGAAASGFDAASVALEEGAGAVHLFARGAEIASQHQLALARNPTLYAPFFDFPDTLRWKIITEGRRRGHAPIETIARAQRHDNFHLHLGTVLQRAETRGSTITLDFGSQQVELDYLIAGTGYRIDLSLRPELRAAAPHVALWRHRYSPAAASGEHWADFPYVDRGFAFQEIEAGEAPWIRDIHAFNYGSILSHGYHVGDIGSAQACIPRLVTAISHDLLQHELDLHLAGMA